jgi:hypothetical protein
MAAEENESRQFRIARIAVKVASMIVGAPVTILSLMALAGAVTGNGFVRVLVGLVLGIGVPMFLAERFLPKDDSVRAPGLVSDVFALFWLGFAFLFAGALHSWTAPLLLREADRLAASGVRTVARVAYFLAAASPEESSAGAPVAPVGSAAASASAEVEAGVAAAADVGAMTPDASPPTPLRHEATPAELFKEWAPAVVSIGVKSRLGEAGGTGFFVDDQGVIATNHHVISDATQVRVKLFSEKWIEDVELLNDDMAVDLALLKITTTEKIKSTLLGDSDGVVIGEHIISIGNPLGLEYTLTDGLVSSRRIFEGRPMIQMSVPVSPGNSGGPLFNMRGEAIGVTTLQVAGGMFGRAQNLNMAAPINVLKAMIKKEYPGRRKFGKDNSSRGMW